MWHASECVTFRFFMENLKEKTLERPGRGYEDIIKMDLKKVGCEACRNLFCSQ